ncbi:hypothetical protein HYPDE_34353 [Hyphomicrobium denitrificans 1NES1]|uniref:Cytochrome c oxidase subunit IV bacterial aa3 type domain-containing protein n=2 Tax=Hyphomicrobium denitrificans TaxID=53399 RepID=N0B8I5_9HYPH|nr:hypothetical protein HYPDE_34353 [Hyphomicrobium denitrificans 1NES1]
MVWTWNGESHAAVDRAKEIQMAHSLAHDDAFAPTAQDRAGGRPRDADFREHLSTYRGFVKGVMLFAGHALAILILLYYFLM